MRIIEAVLIFLEMYQLNTMIQCSDLMQILNRFRSRGVIYQDDFEIVMGLPE